MRSRSQGRGCTYVRRALVAMILPLLWVVKPRNAQYNGQRSLRVIVLTKDRPHSLSKLLNSLQNAQYNGDTVDLRVHIDCCEVTEVLKVAGNFKFSHGQKTITVSPTELGLQGAWLHAWVPADDAERAIILEDDIVLSRLWYVGLREMWDRYGGLTDLAGISLMRQQLVPYPVPGHAYTREIGVSGNPFLYSLVGSIAFSPNAAYWQQFCEWANAMRLSDVDLNVSTPPLITSSWWNQLDRRHIWTQLFVNFSLRFNLFTLYLKGMKTEALAMHTRAKGAHFPTALGPDSEPMLSLPHFSEKLYRYGWDGERADIMQYNVIQTQLLLDSFVIVTSHMARLHGCVNVIFVHGHHLVNEVAEVTATVSVDSLVVITPSFRTSRMLSELHPQHFIYALHESSFLSSPDTWHLSILELLSVSRVRTCSPVEYKA